ncbi:helix-turn-helix domain-containing protein [Yersinia intermedia]|uniref:helix-turn-helix domain-containing protein n=1 Tax=Yersinia intermedia TaxID=631 RepID=UPI00119D6B1B|nr:helix-turn-helix transcriptional regulator [Yersinia intermedia]
MTPEQIKKNFGERVRNIRLEKKISQEELALTANLDRTYISGVERGKRNLSVVNIYKIAYALGIETKELF